MPVLASDMIHDEEDTVRRVGDENAKISGDESHQETDRINDSHNEVGHDDIFFNEFCFQEHITLILFIKSS